VNEITKSAEYLRKEMLSFRQRMGNKTDWEWADDTKLERKIDLAFKGLFHLYIHVNDLTDDDRMHMEAIITEFEQRKMWMEMRELERIK